MSGAVEYFMKHPEMLEQLPKEGLEMLMELVRAERMKLSGVMPQSAVDDLVKAVPDQLVRDIVHDLRKLPEPGGFLPAAKGPPVQGRKSFVERGPLEPPPGIKHVDAIAESFARLDKLEAVERFRRRL